MWKRSFVTIATLLTIGVNWLANSLPLNGRTPGGISDQFSSPFTPAGYVFSIWGPIYAGLLAYSLWQLRPTGTAGSQRLDAIALPYLASAAANVAWIFSWHWLQFGASMLAMLVLLGSLAVIYRRLRDWPPTSRVERWAVDATFSVYFGWVCVATLANLSVWFEASGGRPHGIGEVPWAVAMVATATVVFAALGLRTRDVAYLVVLPWAALGIALREPQVPAVAGVAWLAAAVGAALIAFALAKPRRGVA
jgi:hypothetical protein